jgi:hypothetical protein
MHSSATVSNEKIGERLVERQIRDESFISDAHFAADALKFAAMVIKALYVICANRPRIDVKQSATFKIFEAVETRKGKRKFLFGDNLESEHFVSAVSKMIKSLDERAQIVKEITQYKNNAAPRDALGDFVQNLSRMRIATTLE